MAESRRGYAVPERVLFRKLDDEIVLLDLDSGEYFSLNDTGARVWELVGEGLAAEEIADRLAREFAVTPEVAIEHVRDLCTELLAAGLLEQR